MGLIHFILNFEEWIGTIGEPLKTVEQLLASGMWNVKTPFNAPSTVGGVRAGAVQGLAPPNFTLNIPPTTIFSVGLVPPFTSGGEKVTTAAPPDQAPPAGLHVTVPARTGLAVATPDSRVTRRRTGKAIAVTMRRTLRTLRAMRSPPVGPSQYFPP